MDRKFNLAVIGVGKISIGSHIPAALASSKANLVALVDPDVARATKTAAEFGLNIEIKACLEQLTTPVDGVIIATPNHLHAPLAIAAMAKGYHVLIEKPIAATVMETEDILAQQSKTGLTVAVGYCTRFYPNYLLLKQLLAEQYFGAVRKFAYQMGTAGGWWTYSNYILDRSSIGGGVLVVTGTHFIDRMLDLFGYPTAVTLAEDSLGGPEANARLNLTFDSSDGAIKGYVHFSKNTKLNSGLVIETERGFIKLADNQEDLFFYSHERPDLKVSLTPAQTATSSQFVLQIDDFIDSCLTGKKPMVSASDALLSIQLIEAAYQHSSKLQENFYPCDTEIQ